MESSSNQGSGRVSQLTKIDEELISLSKKAPDKKMFKKSFSIGERGMGSLECEIKKSGIYMYYTTKEKGKKCRIYAGKHHLMKDYRGGISFDEAMNIANSLAIKKQNLGIEALMDEYNANKKREEEKRKYIKESTEQDKLALTFKDLLEYYRDDVIGEKRSSFNEVRNIYNQFIFNNPEFHYLLDKKSKDITVKDMTDLLDFAYEYYDEKITNSLNKLRTYLQTAFKRGMKYDNKRKNKDSVAKFFIKSNPLNDIEEEDQEVFAAPVRELTDKEIWLLWHKGVEIMGKAGYLTRLLFSIGGVRQKQLIKVQWQDIDLDFDIPNVLVNAEIGRNAKKNKGDVCRLPLTPLALDEVLFHQRLSGHCKFLLPKSRGSKLDELEPMGKTHSKYTDRMSVYMSKECGLSYIRPFTLKMIRHSVTNRMIEAQCDETTILRIQSHKVEDKKDLLDSVHERDYVTADFIDDKNRELLKFEKYIKNIIDKPFDEVEDRVPENKHKHKNKPRPQGS